jgi:hypothetical protein
MREEFVLLWITLIVFGFFAFVRYLRYREVCMLAEKGLVRPRSGNGRDALGWGLGLTALGLALMVGLYPVGWMIDLDGLPLMFGPWMLLGLIPTFIGLALVLYYVLTRREATATAALADEPTAAAAMPTTEPVLSWDMAPADAPPAGPPEAGGPA